MQGSRFGHPDLWL